MNVAKRSVDMPPDGIVIMPLMTHDFSSSKQVCFVTLEDSAGRCEQDMFTLTSHVLDDTLGVWQVGEIHYHLYDAELRGHDGAVIDHLMEALVRAQQNVDGSRWYEYIPGSDSGGVKLAAIRSLKKQGFVTQVGGSTLNPTWVRG